jgi:CheY-like chemotaxis protein
MPGAPLAVAVAVAWRRRLKLSLRKRARPILIVDDSADIRVLVREVLSGAGFTCVTAADGAEALRRIEESPPALILLDINMPHVDGPAFARELRMRLRHIPLIVMTALSRPDREADRCNANAVLAKPFDTDVLVGLVRRYSR